MDLDGYLLHQEHQEYRTYVNQYNQDKLEREMHQRMVIQEQNDDQNLLIAAKSVKYLPRSELNVTQPAFVKQHSALRDIRLGTSSPKIYESGDTRYEEEQENEAADNSPVKMQPISIRTQNLSHAIKGSQASGNITSLNAFVADKETDHDTN